MAKRILQDMYTGKDDARSGETIIKIIRKDYRSPEQVIVEAETANPIDDIEIPGEIDIGSSENDSENYNSDSVLRVRNTIVSDKREISAPSEENDISPEKKSLVARLVPRRMKQSGESIPSSLPIAHDLVLAKKSTEPSQPISQKSPRIPFAIRFPRVSKKMIVIILCVVGGGAIIYGGLSFFEKAYITIHPKSKQFTLTREAFTASKDSRAGINFEIMVFDDIESKNMSFVDTDNVSIKATGDIILFNEYSQKPQTLVAGTYLADRSGKAYQITKKTTIPGYTLSKAKTIIPGQILAQATAFLPGEEYNTTTGNFTVTSFKKDPVKFKKIYGKLKTPFRGGAQGSVYVLTEAQKATLGAYAQSTFRNNLVKKVQAQIPKGYLFFPSGSNFSYSVDTGIKSKTPSGKVAISGTISAVLLRESDVSRSLVERLLPKVSQSEAGRISFENIQGLTLDFAPNGQAVTKNITMVSFTFSGNINALWNPDTEKLRANSVGIPKSSLPSFFASDPGIGNARVTIFPPWKNKLPKNIEKIIIVRE